ncbi:MAG: hypothetical protein L0Z62_17215 [Gemmataceae bacterium]|nr:hypothetical protein [Gemmataceae bacterium]
MASSELAVDFRRERAVYEQHRAELERAHQGKVALIQGDQLVGVFKDIIEACEQGYQRFGAAPFLLQEIGDPVHVMPLAIVPECRNGDSGGQGP